MEHRAGSPSMLASASLQRPGPQLPEDAAMRPGRQRGGGSCLQSPREASVAPALGLPPPNSCSQATAGRSQLRVAAPYFEVAVHLTCKGFPGGVWRAGNPALNVLFPLPRVHSHGPSLAPRPLGLTADSQSPRMPTSSAVPEDMPTAPPRWLGCCGA